ncbi:ribosomal protein S6 kinase delta-1 isoform X5 [Leucoraja erinacea]|uniref:ribosomal protein S6 kinase delta-1 isoform X5 n=1 Tax=Leucoraja erinaceus TaxID=7782 RepID=UPI0024543E60|nr:ribosomal protein S6 kinase delta-1 isoform X5 [Leucoraja erinacea]
MLSQGQKGDLARFYTVTDPKRHRQGYTVYKVTARVVSRRTPEEVQEIVVWKRYNDFKKLHKEFWQLHKTLYRHPELFPPFAKGKVFGRFDKSVIEERRQCAEDLLQFSANVPALYNSKQLEDFFKDGEVHDGSELIGPVDPSSESLNDSLSDGSSEARRDFFDDVTLSSQSECGGESSPSRREAVKKKTAEYLMRAEQISTRCLRTPVDGGSLQSWPPGPLSSRPAWNLRSPAEELKAFRVLGVIDKVLLVLDSRTQETFILKSLRKSSEGSRNKKTIIPHSVPNMVQLKKQIVSEDSIFLLLQHAEGGKLWSYVCKFLQKMSDESFKSSGPDERGSRRLAVHDDFTVDQLNTEGLGSSVGSGASDLGNVLQDQPMNNNLTSSSQDDSSAPDEDTQDSSHELLGSPSSDSEADDEECTSSYLTLCHEYEQEKKEPDSLSSETFPTVCEDAPGSSADTGMTKRSHSLLSNDSLCSPTTIQELRFFTEDIHPDAFSPVKASDSLNLSKNSPMEFFRIDSKDSTNELASLELGDKPEKVESALNFNLVPETDNMSNFDASDIKLDSTAILAPDDYSRESSNDSVPVISFQDAAGGDTSSCEEGRPDLLVNLPGVSQDGEAAGEFFPDKCSVTNTDNSENRLYAKPDVLQINYNIDQCMNSQRTQGLTLQCEDSSSDGNINKVFGHQLEPSENRKDADLNEQLGTNKHVEKEAEFNSMLPITKTENTLSFVSVESCSTLDLTHSIQNASPIPQLSDPIGHYQTVSGEDYSDHKELARTMKEIADKNEDSDEERAFGEHLGICDQGRQDCASEFTSEKTAAERFIVTREIGNKLVSQMFKELEESLVRASNARIPESCIQHWAAEMVGALDALHREGIVCHDLNPNNILLDDKGHIQLTYFSRWSEVADSYDSSAIEKMYCAPEVGGIAEKTDACDWWSLGAILFELLTGKPLFQCHPAGINTHTALNLPDHISEEARSVVQQLLQFNPSERLGAGVSGVEDIKSHPFFQTVDWSQSNKVMN